MMTDSELRQCYRLPGAYPVSLLSAYFSLCIGRKITDEETLDALQRINERMDSEELSRAGYRDL
jgi:hypothetical protein